MAGIPGCRDCVFWLAGYSDGEADRGQCRKHAPKPKLDIDSTYISIGVVWPMVGPDDWCGEYETAGRQLNGDPPSSIPRPTVDSRPAELGGGI